MGAAAPAGAFGQQIGPTDEEYDNGVLGVSASGDPSDPGDPADPVDPAEATAEIGELPFTGLDVAAIAAIGAGLIGTGFMVRKASRTEQDPTV